MNPKTKFSFKPTADVPSVFGYRGRFTAPGASSVLGSPAVVAVRLAEESRSHERPDYAW